MVIQPPSNAVPLLEMRGIIKSFGGVKALRDGNLRIHQGEVLGLVGQNGAGKSTILRVLDGQIPHGQFAGTYLLGGAEAQFSSPHEARKAGIAIVPQETSVLETLSVAENVCLAAHRQVLVSTASMYKQAQEFFDRWGFPLNARTLTSRLSTSERQLVMIARALFEDPKILILDEPTSSLTPSEVEVMFGVLRTLKANGLATVFVSHRLDEVLDICDRVTVFRDGLTTADEPVASLTLDRLISLMIGRQLGDLFPASRGTVMPQEVLRVSDLIVNSPNDRRRRLVDGVSISVKAGEIVGIGGLVGSGRTEVLKAIFGALPVAAGTVEVLGRTIDRRTPRLLLAAGVALVPEDRKGEGLLFNLGVRPNVTLAEIGKFGRVFIRGRAESRRVAAVIDEFGIVTASTDALVGTLSGGNQQKVLLARSLERKPKVVLLDEPTVGVDVGAKSEIYRLIAELAKAGTSVLLVSSESAELLGLCDRVYVMRKGLVVDEFPREVATEHRLLSSAVGDK